MNPDRNHGSDRPNDIKFEEMKRCLKYITVSLKGIGMGAADVIPGVSGGTIAFMTGIYEELVASINAINMTAVKLLFSGKLKAFWEHINGNFLLSLFAGIMISVFSLAKLMQFLLANHPIQTWAFFFGLITASSFYILRDIKDWKVKDAVTIAAGIVLGVVVCTLSPTDTPDDLWFIFICGAIAVCAMILPGISGSFILLILGKYEYIMGAVASVTEGRPGQSLAVLGVFAVGAVCGLLAFSKFLHWLLAKYHRPTLIVLAGFIIGSLVKVWPWSDKMAILLSQYPDFDEIYGECPSSLTEMAPGMVDWHIPGAVCFALLGIAVVIVLEVLSHKKQNR